MSKFTCLWRNKKRMDKENVRAIMKNVAEWHFFDRRFASYLLGRRRRPVHLFRRITSFRNFFIRQTTSKHGASTGSLRASPSRLDLIFFPFFTTLTFKSYSLASFWPRPYYENCFHIRFPDIPFLWLFFNLKIRGISTYIYNKIFSHIWIFCV